MAEELVKRGELVSDDLMLKILTNKLDTLYNQVSLSRPRHPLPSSTEYHSRGSSTVSQGPSDREKCWMRTCCAYTTTCLAVRMIDPDTGPSQFH